MKIKPLLLASILSIASFSTFAETVNINKANAAAFDYYLNGIGEKKAKDIVAYRAQHKTFKNIEEIKSVKGIGEGIFKKIKADLSLTKGEISAPKKTEKVKKSTKTSKTSKAIKQAKKP